MKYQGIYDRSPIFFQNFMATMYGYKGIILRVFRRSTSILEEQ